MQFNYCGTGDDAQSCLLSLGSAGGCDGGRVSPPPVSGSSLSAADPTARSRVQRRIWEWPQEWGQAGVEGKEANDGTGLGTGASHTGASRDSAGRATRKGMLDGSPAPSGLGNGATSLRPLCLALYSIPPSKPRASHSSTGPQLHTTSSPLLSTNQPLRWCWKP